MCAFTATGEAAVGRIAHGGRSQVLNDMERANLGSFAAAELTDFMFQRDQAMRPRLAQVKPTQLHLQQRAQMFACALHQLTFIS